MKKRSVIILSLCMALSLTACGGKSTATDSSSDSSAASGTSATSEASDTSEVSDTQTASDKPSVTASATDAKELSVCDVDCFSPCKESKYLSFLLYNPDASFQLFSYDKDNHPEKIVATIPIAENDILNDDFSYAYDDEDGYFNCVRVQDMFIPRSNTYEVYSIWFTPELALNLCTSTGNQQEFDEIDRPLYEITKAASPSLIADKYSDETEGVNSEYGEYSFGDGWGYYIPADEMPTTTSSLYIPLSKGTDDSTLYGKMFLPEEIPFNDESLTTAAAQGNFTDACSYSAIEDIDQIDNVQATIGNAPKLSETVFYQDLIAHYVSENYGLNLRDKNAYMQTDPDYIEYSTMGYHVDIAAYHSDVPEKVKELSVESFSYTDKEGTEYSYYIHDKEPTDSVFFVYIFRDDVITGRLSIDVAKEQDVISMLGNFFGRRP